MTKSLSQIMIKNQADEFFDKGLRRAIQISKSKLRVKHPTIESIIDSLEMEVKDPLSLGRYQIPDNMKD